MNMQVGDIIQYYAYKILDVLDQSEVVSQCEYCKFRHIGQIKREAPTHLPENRYN